MSSASRRLILPEIEYPTRDGKPMAETELHWLVTAELIEMLRAWYATEKMVWVGGDQLLYYVEGDPRKSTSPDVMVALGIPKLPLRDIYLVWKEGKAPDVVIEVSSRKTRREDVLTKFELYRDVLKVREYFLFDPRAEYLKPPLQGYRLRKGDYVAIPEASGRLPSKMLGLHLERDGEWLRLYDPANGQRLLSSTEARQKLQEAEAEVKRLRQELESSRRRTRQSRRDLESLRRQRPE
jgi:Uma2 family endonuclease